MENMENRIFDMLRDPECVVEIQQIIRGVLKEKVAEIRVETGLSELEVLDRLAGVA